MSASSNPGWRDFWKFNIRESCIADNTPTAKQVADAWIAWFDGLADGARILDIATGNGIVLAHAAAAARAGSRHFELAGIDLADIDPPRYVQNLDPDVEQARFLAGTAAEKLPFDDATFDVVASQFGLEYAKLDQALSEVTRVTTAGGRLIWLAHSPGSTIVNQHAEQGREVDYLLASRGPVYFMKQLIERQRRHKNIKFSLDKLYACFADAGTYCRENPSASIVREVCGEFAQAVNRLRSIRPDDLERMIRTAELRLIAHRNRVNSLKAAVMTEPKLDDIRARLSTPAWSDLTVEEYRIDAADRPIGVHISATRS